MSSILKVDEIQDTSGNNIINENAGTVTIGKAGNTTNIVGTLQNDGSALISGITVADQWRLTADKSINNTLSVIDANLEQVDTTGQGTLGTAMSESSGIFTFPSTGIYLVISNATFQNSNTSNSNYVFIEHQITTNNSTYTNSVESYQYFNIPTGTIYATATGIDMVDVTDTSNVKVRFRARSQSDCAVRAATDTSFTSFTFIRLGDT